MPLFSVIIPVFNRASMICSTIDSVINQQFSDFEIIIIDDGSTDELHFILFDYIKRGILRYYYQLNSGVSSARNLGAKKSTGKYLIFLDSDDKVTVNWLSDYAERIFHVNPDIVFCGINRFVNNILVQYTDPLNPYNDGKSLGNFIAGSFCIRMSIFNNIGGYDEKLAYGENTELGFRIKKVNPSISFITAPNLLYFLQDNSHGKNAKNKMNGIVYTIKKHPNLFDNNKNLKCCFYSIAGVSAIQCMEYKSAKKYFWFAFIISPLNLNMLLRLICSFSPWVCKKIWDNQ